MKSSKEHITNLHQQLIQSCNAELISQLNAEKENLIEVLPIIQFIIERLNTVFYLTVSNLIWDAEIVLRCATETFVKFLFISSSTNQERKIRQNEYWSDLSEINSIKQSNQARINLDVLGESTMNHLACSGLILSDEQETILRQKWPKKERQRIEQKWSFTEMVKSLSKSYENQEFKIFLAMLHGYRMSSHVIHGDETGVGIIDERNGRKPKEKETAYFAHYLRLLSDCLTYNSFLGVQTMKYLSKDTKFFFDNFDKIEKVQPLIKEYHEKVFVNEEE